MGIFIVLAAVILVLALQLFLAKRGLKGISAQIDADKNGAEPGEIITITLTIRNGSLLLRPFIGYEILLHEDMKIEAESGSKTSGSVFLWPRTSVKRKIEVSVPQRGNYRFGHVILKTGDFLGIKEESYDISELKSVSIYPKRLEGEKISKSTGGILGDMPVRRYIFEDPVLFTGFRDYTGREPMKDISWLQSARTGKLMVRQYDHTSEMSATVVIDTYGATSEEAETVFSLARDVCMQLDEASIEYSLCMNAALGGAGVGGNFVARGMGSAHLHAIYMLLANALYECRYTDEELMKGALKNSGQSSAFIVITARECEAKREVLGQLPAHLHANMQVIYATSAR